VAPTVLAALGGSFAPAKLGKRHLPDPDRILAEVDRSLAPDGRPQK